jgi:hypothetical protein|tara:strand:+ start:1213 stop:1752 length:540 start_codon:yes stop_codon:yes gene_type:complete
MELKEAITAVQQPRSRYQLERFVLGQHDTVEMQFYQCVIELNSSVFKHESALINLERMERQITRLEESDEEDADLDLREKKLEYDHFVGVVNGSEREILCLLDIYEQIPHFSRDEIDHAQPEYWEKRLGRQASLSIMSGKIGWPELDALRQIGKLDDLIEEHQKTAIGMAEQEISGSVQ